MAVGYNLSLSDLMLVDGFAEAFGSGLKEQIHPFLTQNGLDVTQGVEEFVCKHRNLRGEVVDCLLYQGHEISSQEWLKSGYSSWSNILEHSDLELRIALKTMGQQSNNTGSIIDHVARHSN